jgi:hypothetical protein
VWAKRQMKKTRIVKYVFYNYLCGQKGGQVVGFKFALNVPWWATVGNPFFP